jgi:S-adenosylmethionine hydrolase
MEEVGNRAPSSEAIFENGGAVGRVMSFDRLGNVQTSFVAQDLQRLGVAVGDQIKLSSGDKTFEVHLGESVFEARLGEWVAFVSLEGRLIVSRSYGRAVTALETDVDEPIAIRPAGEPDEPATDDR